MRTSRIVMRNLLLLSVLALLLAACGLLDPDAEATTEPEATADTQVDATATSEGPAIGEAEVEEIEVLILESFPVQVNVIASGNLPDGCTTLNEPSPRREGNTFVVNLATSRVQDEICTQAQVPFDKVIPLDVLGLDAGTYTVSVNGVTDSFELAVDNVSQPEETATPAPPAEAGSISGKVWHDLCAISGGEGGEPTVPSDGCLENSDGTYQANGALDAGEPGIEDVMVTLGEGNCPSAGLATTTTDADGDYEFAELGAGLYCVTVDPLSDVNSPLLVPGDWTAPAGTSGTAAVAATVAEGEDSTGVDFGWDYQFLPEPDDTISNADDCTDSADFVADVTIQDNEVIPPGWVITKTWRLQNDGTCTWTEGYELAFVKGDLLGAPQTTPLPRDVPEEGIIELSIVFRAPEINGTYNSQWELRNEQGEGFGIPEPFWVQFQVTAAVPDDGSAISGMVWDDSCPGDATATTEGCVADGSDGFRADGEWDGDEDRIEGLSVSLSEGACEEEGDLIGTQLTNSAGRYYFDGLVAGEYCVSIDPGAGNNDDVLGSGQWTAPELTDGVVGITVELVDNEGFGDVWFGWDVITD